MSSTSGVVAGSFKPNNDSDNFGAASVNVSNVVVGNDVSGGGVVWSA